jgi:hypothetical protein
MRERATSSERVTSGKCIARFRLDDLVKHVLDGAHSSVDPSCDRPKLAQVLMFISSARVMGTDRRGATAGNNGDVSADGQRSDGGKGQRRSAAAQIDGWGTHSILQVAGASLGVTKRARKGDANLPAGRFGQVYELGRAAA